MKLKDISELIEEAELNYLGYFNDPYEIELNEEFKRKYVEYTGSNMSFYKYTSVEISPSNLKIIIPNQWFLIASFFGDVYNELSVYKNLIDKIGIPKSELKTYKDTYELPENIKQLIEAYFNEQEHVEEKDRNLELFTKFLTDYSWWRGKKTLDRGDYFYSPILDTAKLLQASQSHVAEICKKLTPELASILKDNYTYHNKSSNYNHQQFVIYYGAPGTGKSHTIKEKLKDVPKGNIETVTFHPDYDYVSFVGGYRPISEDNNIEYKFVPQVFTNLYVKSWQNPNEPFYLVIEEINRGNCAEIFGDIFQLLDQNQDYTVTPSSELKSYLDNELSKSHEGIADGLKMPPNLSILATMNTSDQSLFPMDSAFKRRWDWEYIPIHYNRDDENKSSKFIVDLDDGTYFSWLEFIERVNIQIKSNPNLGMDKCIGNYFINPTDNTISLNTFINKAIFYLWNDVFKDEFGSDSIFAENVTYEDFFPVKDNGAKMVIAILETLNFKLSDGKYTVLNEDTN